MSIWATHLMFADAEDHGETYHYEASHVMPTEDHRGGPVLDLAAIPADVEAQRLGVDVLDDSVLDLFLPWLRVALGPEAACVLDLGQVEALFDVLGVWLDRQKTEGGT